MPIACPVTLDTAHVRQDIRAMYSRVATEPSGAFHFHRGPAHAVERLGYDAAALAALPTDVTACFAGIGNPHLIAPLPPGATVLDVGCGAGTDLLLAALLVGPSGRAIGVDMTDAMRAQARSGAARAGLENVEVRAGDATTLPVEDGAVDIVISNGVLNLVPEKRQAISEMRRVLRPGGRIQIADIVLGTPLPEASLRDIELWTGWIAGALLEAELIEAFTDGGFRDVRITHHFDCFDGTTKQGTARRYGVRGANVSAIRAWGTGEVREAAAPFE